MDTDPDQLQQWEEIYQSGEEDLVFLTEKFDELLKEALAKAKAKNVITNESKTRV